MSIGIKISKNGVNALTNTDPRGFSVNTDYDTFKYTPPFLTTSISVTTAGGVGATATNTSIIPLPSYIGFNPYYFTYISEGSISQYDYLSGNIYSAYILGNPTNSTLTAVVAYASGGTTTVSINFAIYLFGNVD